MMTRGLAKRRELALRLALGASRGAVVKQMFTECALITIGGAALGAIIAFWGTDLLQNRMPPEVAWVGLVRPQLSWRVFALGAGAAALSSVLFGLLPAMRVAFNLNLDEPLKDDAGTTTGRVRYRYNPLVIAEVGLALVLMMGGGLLLRTVHQLQQEKSDTNDDTLWRGWVYLQRTQDTTVHRIIPTRRALQATIAGVPGVVEFAFRGGRQPRGGVISGEQTQDSTHTITMQSYPIVTPGYLHVVGLPILRGRDFEPGDAAGPGVAILDALAAQRLYPGEEAVGHMEMSGMPRGRRSGSP
jgi:putative ABC transport system permease protein